MNPLFPARRSADTFDTLVEGGARDDLDAATRDLLDVVGALRSVPTARARPEFVSDLRAQLMAAAETELAAVPSGRHGDQVERLTVRPARSRRERRLKVALGTVAIMGATTSMAVASQGALPGDALYPVKRAIENTQAGFSVGDDAQGETLLGNASRRLDEVDRLSRREEPDAALVAQTLDTFTQQFEDGSSALVRDYQDHGDPAAINQLHVNAADSIEELTDLAAVVPPAAQGALQTAAAIVAAADSSAVNLCPDPACGEPLGELPATLAGGVSDTLGALGAAGDDLGDGLGDTLSGGTLPGTSPSPGFGADGSGTSGLNPPKDPVVIPSLPTQPTDSTSGTGSGPLDDLLPGGGDTSPGDGSTGHHGGKGGKGKPVDLSPVTDTVDQVVTGVVQGVNDLLGGLTGGSTSGTGAGQ